VVAVSDAAQNRIHLAYEKDKYVIFDAAHFTKGAYVAIAEIQADRTKSYITLPQYVERTGSLGLFTTSGKLWLAYTPITNFADCDVMVSTYESNFWTKPVWLGDVGRGPGPNNYSNCHLHAPILSSNLTGLFASSLVNHSPHFFGMLHEVDPALVPAPDTFPPIGYFTAPLANGDPEIIPVSVSGTYPATVSSQDDTGVSKVEFYVDGILQSSVLDSPYVWNWDTTQLPNLSQHTLSTKAYDLAGNSRDFYNQAVTIDQSVPTVTPTPIPSATVTQMPTSTPLPTMTPTPTQAPDMIKPSVTITSPQNGATVNRNTNIIISANATDNIGVTKVEFYVDSVLLCSDSTSPYSCTWKVPNKKGASSVINVKAYDQASNVGAQTISVLSK
jgi:hypothetical protein